MWHLRTINRRTKRNNLPYIEKYCRTLWCKGSQCSSSSAAGVSMQMLPIFIWASSRESTSGACAHGSMRLITVMTSLARAIRIERHAARRAKDDDSAYNNAYIPKGMGWGRAKTSTKWVYMSDPTSKGSWSSLSEGVATKTKVETGRQRLARDTRHMIWS